ncbi:MAG: alpha/beta fold hydrolase [Actinomycetota bacterium]
MHAPRSRLVRLAAAMSVATIVLVACDDADPSAPPAGSEAVSFTTADGVEIDGRLFGDPGSSAGVVLAHMQPADQTSWYGFAETLADEGYRALTFNFRGYCPGGEAGCSGGETDQAQLWQDVEAAAGFLRSKGVPRIGVIGASMGGTAALVAASQPGSRIGSAATLSAPMSIGALTVTPEQLSSTGAAKLFVAGNGDAVAAEAAQQLYDLSIPPKRVEIFPSEDHGTDLLEGNQGPNVRQLLLRWLAQFLPEAPAGDESSS